MQLDTGFGSGWGGNQGEGLPETMARLVSTFVQMTNSVMFHVKSGEVKSVRSWMARRIMLTMQTKPASRKMPDSAILRLVDCCSLQMKGSGSKRMAMSVAMLGIEFPSRKAVLSTQWPPGIVRSHQKVTGVQEKIETRVWRTVSDLRVIEKIAWRLYDGNVPADHDGCENVDRDADLMG